MDDPATPDLPPDWREAAYAAFELADRDYICMLKLAFDPDPQLRAIQGMLARNRQTDQELVTEIREAEEHAKKVSGIWNDYAVDQWVDLVHHSVYQDATHSMSAVGVLAPFIEGIFTQCFLSIGRRCFATGSPPSGHDRWKTADPATWDCHFQHVGGRLQKASIVDGAKQLVEETGLQQYLPLDFWLPITALFAYRNKMFHHGLEWPEVERQRFHNRIADDNWPMTWFSQATSGDEPWVFYMTEEFIGCCYEAAGQLLDAFGRLIKNNLRQRLVMDDFP